MEKTLVIIKPEGVKRGLVGEYISRFEKKGLAIKQLAVKQIPAELAKIHYAHLADKPFFQGIIDAFTASEVVLMILEGECAVAVVRKMIGATNPLEAEPGTIRGDFGGALPYNIIHASDSVESAEIEIKRFFSDSWQD